MKGCDFRRGVQTNRRERGADPTTDVQVGRIESVQPLGIRASEVGQADVHSREAQLDLAAMPVPRQGQRNASLGRLGEDLGTMRQEKCRDGRIEAPQGGLQVGTPGAEIVDPGDREGALFDLGRLMHIDQERNPLLPREEPPWYP